MHHLHMRDVAVTENGCVHLLFPDDLFEILLGINSDTFGVVRSGQIRRIDTAFDVGYLSGGEPYHLCIRVVTKNDIEVVEVSSGRSENH
jgi:hypothetical protein